MRRTAVAVTLGAIVALSACTDRSLESPEEPSSSATRVAVRDRAADEAHIAKLINSLFAPKRQGELFKQFARVKAQTAAGRAHEAQAAVVGFVASALADLSGGTLEDPNGSAPPSITDALRELLNDVATFGGLGAPIPASNPLAGDGVVAVVGPLGGTVMTASGSGGVLFPTAALRDSTIIVITRLPNGTTPRGGPLPSDFDQYPPFVEIVTSPALERLDRPITIGLCPLPVGSEFGPATQTVAARLQLAHREPPNAAAVELLTRVEPGFLSCASKVGGATSSAGQFGAVDAVRLRFASVAAGDLHTCALTVDAEAWCWGHNIAGQLGDGTNVDRLVPTRVATTLRFSKISAGEEVTCALATDGRAYCWGHHATYRLADAASYRPAAVLGGHTFVDIGTGRDFACGLTASGEIWCWGYQPGDSRMDGCGFTAEWPCSDAPLLRSPQSITFTKLSVGQWSACGVTLSGTAYCFGDANYGGFGSGWTPRVTVPAVVAANGMMLSSIYDGIVHECGLDTDGRAWCWGLRGGGALGEGSTGTIPFSAVLPVAVLGDLRFAALSVSDAGGYGSTCGITPEGKAYCWGSDAHEELGAAATDLCTLPIFGQFPCSPRPVPVESSERFAEISVGARHACGVTLRREVLCWGSNSAGQLGTGSMSSEPVPTPIRPQ